jgi:hypothetical protein
MEKGHIENTSISLSHSLKHEREEKRGETCLHLCHLNMDVVLTHPLSMAPICIYDLYLSHPLIMRYSIYMSRYTPSTSLIIYDEWYGHQFTIFMVLIESMFPSQVICFAYMFKGCHLMLAICSPVDHQSWPSSQVSCA